MTTRTIAFLSVVFVVALVWASWMFRYVPLHPSGSVYEMPPILDRWTGEILFQGEWWPVHAIAEKEAEIEARKKPGFTPLEK